MSTALRDHPTLEGDAPAMNLMTLLERATAATGDRVAVGGLRTGMTGERLLGNAAAFAGRLRAARVHSLVFCDEPSEVLPVALLGAAAAGVAFVPINYRLTDRELRSLAERTVPALAVAGRGTAARLASVEGLEVIERDVLRDDPGGGAPAAERADWPTDPDLVAVMIYTSGTSGPPKATVLRHRHLVAYLRSHVEFASAGPDEAHIMAVPPYHIASVAAQLSQIYAGRRIVPLARFDADAWIEVARAEDVTHAMLVPTMLSGIVDALEHRDEVLESVRFVAYGGGRSHRPVIEKALSRLPRADFSHAYGLTEACSTVCVLGPDDHRRAAASDDPDLRATLSSVGRPLAGVELTVRDADGVEVAHGDSGVIWIRGEQVSGEYAESGSTLDDNGWFCTRDLGSLDADGRLWLQGRADDVIVRGGENLSPGEIEAAVITHPDVVDAAAFAVTSHQWGEEVAVCVVARRPATPSADDIREHVRARLRSSRVPARVEFVDELPYNDTGKLLRRQLRNRFARDDD